MDMTIGTQAQSSRQVDASPLPAAASALSEEQRKRVASCKAFMVAPGKLETVEAWRSAFRSMVEIVATMERSDEVRQVQGDYEEWKQKATEYGVFNHQNLRDSMGNFFKTFNDRLLNRLAILISNEAAAA